MASPALRTRAVSTKTFLNIPAGRKRLMTDLDVDRFLVAPKRRDEIARRIAAIRRCLAAASRQPAVEGAGLGLELVTFYDLGAAWRRAPTLGPGRIRPPAATPFHHGLGADRGDGRGDRVAPRSSLDRLKRGCDLATSWRKAPGFGTVLAEPATRASA